MKNEMPLISVIVPVYNVEKYLSKCVESIINQTYKNLEIILVDDGSTDNSLQICEKYAQKDNRIKVIHKKNGGQATARNIGLDIAEGEYIGFVDADDYIHSEMYDKLIKRIQKFNSGIVMCGRFNVDEVRGISKPLFEFNSEVVFEDEEILRRFFITDHIDGSPCDKLFDKNIIGEMRFPEGYICEDIPFIYNILKGTNKVVHIGEPLYFYLQRRGSTSKPNKISEKTRGITKYSADIRTEIYKNKTELIEEVDYFYFTKVIAFNDMILNYGRMFDKNILRIYKENGKIIQEHYKCIMKNRYLSKVELIKIKMINYNIYHLCKIAWKFIKGEN